MSKWSREYSALATAEGWDVFNNSDYGERIERIDCPEDGSEPVFADDNEAIQYVSERAFEGLPYHVIACEIHDANPNSWK